VLAHGGGKKEASGGRGGTPSVDRGEFLNVVVIDCKCLCRRGQARSSGYRGE